jgi:beta-phosphoglucomutase-like phosphatase (HAD superfamily)
VTRAALWDLDGTLVDSADDHWRAWRDTLRALAFDLTYHLRRASRVEDAGVEAARRAGMTCVAVSRTAVLAGDVFTRSLADLAPDAFERLLAHGRQT